MFHVCKRLVSVDSVVFSVDFAAETTETEEYSSTESIAGYPPRGTRDYTYRVIDREKYRQDRAKMTGKRHSTSRSGGSSSQEDASKKLKSMTKSQLEKALKKSEKEKADALKSAAAARKIVKSTERIARRQGKGSTKKRYCTSDKAYKRLIKACIEEEFWAHIKFWPSQDEEERKLCVLFFKSMSGRMKALAKKVNSQKLYREWEYDNINILAASINTHRQYVCSRLKDVCGKYWKNHGKTLPSEEDMLACMTRTLKIFPEDGDDENDPQILANYQLFKWYWDEFLPRVPGNNFSWTFDKRAYVTIIEGHPEGAKDKPYMPADHEAFALTAYSNFRSAWLEIFPVKLNHDEYHIAYQLKANDPNHPEFTLVKGQKNQIKLHHPKFFGKWTQNDAGSCRVGGWKTEGLNRYIELRTLAKQTREKPESLEYEKNFLAQLREDYEITAPTHKQHLKLKRAKSKDNSGLAAVTGPKLFGDFGANDKDFELVFEDEDEENYPDEILDSEEESFDSKAHHDESDDGSTDGE